MKAYLLIISIATFNLMDVSSQVKVQSNVKNIIETKPEFIGGNDSLIAFLARNIKYPEAAVSREIEGKVYMVFKVFIDSTIEIISYKPKSKTILANEAKRVLLKTNKKWVPATLNGIPVVSKCKIPITFEID